MGCILSHVESIDRIRFTKLKAGQLAKAVRAMDLGNGGAIIELSGGRFTVVGVPQCKAINNNCAVLGFGRTDPSKSVLNGLAKMGVITRSDVSSHLRRVEDLHQRDKKNWAKKSLERACADLGIPVPEVSA